MNLGGSLNTDFFEAVAFFNPKNTSRRCPKFGFIHTKNRKTQENFVCLSCKYSGDADAKQS